MFANSQPFPSASCLLFITPKASVPFLERGFQELTPEIVFHAKLSYCLSLIFTALFIWSDQSKLNKAEPNLAQIERCVYKLDLRCTCEQTR